MEDKGSAKQEVLSTNNDPRREPSKKAARRKRQGNSEEFNAIMSEINKLSVVEKTRLTKSLAGQLGLTVLGPDQIIDLGKAKGESVTKAGAAVGQQNQQRANPLKGTAFDVALQQAKSDVKKARAEAGTESLPPDHPAVVALKNALANFRAQKSLLAPVEQPKAAQKAPKQPSKKEVTGKQTPTKGGMFASAGRLLTGKRSGSDVKEPLKKSRPSEEMDDVNDVDQL